MYKFICRPADIVCLSIELWSLMMGQLKLQYLVGHNTLYGNQIVLSFDILVPIYQPTKGKDRWCLFPFLFIFIIPWNRPIIIFITALKDPALCVFQ